MNRARTASAAALAAVLLTASPPPSPAQVQGLVVPGGAGFVGDGKCGNPTCHGAGLPATEQEKAEWRPYKSARSQWRNRNIDRHSRAYATLETEGGRAIARYMGIRATTSDKCLACHAPAAPAAAGTTWRRRDGVTCEHCHGAAEPWLEAHVERDWNAKKSGYPSFVDNTNFRTRAERCAACHTVIDHEILAGGHPPLQFEMVAYAQIMKHWDDQEDQPAGSFSVDPTLWAVGQAVGLESTLGMVSARAVGSNYQSLGKFEHFRDQNCFQCHHKLVLDAVRGARGHWAMLDQILAVRDSAMQKKLAAQWRELVAASTSDADATAARAKEMAATAGSLKRTLASTRLGRDQTRRLLKGITASGSRLRQIDRSSFRRPPRSNVLTMSGIGMPWWYTTGAPEQAALAIGALCEPGFGAATCRGLRPQRRELLGSLDRFDFSPDRFEKALGAIHAGLK